MHTLPCRTRAVPAAVKAVEAARLTHVDRHDLQQAKPRADRLLDTPQAPPDTAENNRGLEVGRGAQLDGTRIAHRLPPAAPQQQAPLQVEGRGAVRRTPAPGYGAVVAILMRRRDLVGDVRCKHTAAA